MSVAGEDPEKTLVTLVKCRLSIPAMNWLPKEDASSATASKTDTASIGTSKPGSVYSFEDVTFQEYAFQKAAFVKLVTWFLTTKTERSLSDEEFFDRLSQMVRHQPSYVKLVAEIESFGRRHRLSEKDAMWMFVQGGQRLTASLFVGVIAPVAIEIQLRRHPQMQAAASWANILLSNNKAIDELLAGMMTGPGSPLDVAEAAMRWSNDGRPGLQNIEEFSKHGACYRLPNFNELPNWRPVCLMLTPYLGDPPASAVSIIEMVEAALMYARDYEKEKDFA